MTPVKQYFAASKDDALRKYNIVLARAMAGIKYVDNKLERVVRKHEQSMGLFDQLQESFDKNSKAADERAEAMPGLIEETLSKLHTDIDQDAGEQATFFQDLSADLDSTVRDGKSHVADVIHE